MQRLTVDFIISLDGNGLFDGRLQQLGYVPTVLEGPPGNGAG
jgi:hypothetical protein